MTLYVDYAWTHPNAQAIYDAGYRGVMRYLSNDSSKDLSVAEAKALHAAGLGIGLVWETTASRARAGEAAGKADAAAANTKADALGFPASCPIFYAVDYDALVNDITPYFIGIGNVPGRPVGVYGSYYVVKAMMAAYANYGWQTMAWSGGQKLTTAHLYQTLNHTWPIPGVVNSAWDENVLLHSFPLWTPTTTPEDTMSQADIDAITSNVNGYTRNLLIDGYTVNGVAYPGVAKVATENQKRIGGLATKVDALAVQVTDLAAALTALSTATGVDAEEVKAIVQKGVDDALADVKITLDSNPVTS